MQTCTLSCSSLAAVHCSSRPGVDPIMMAQRLRYYRGRVFIPGNEFLRASRLQSICVFVCMWCARERWRGRAHMLPVCRVLEGFKVALGVHKCRSLFLCCAHGDGAIQSLSTQSGFW